MFNLWFSIKFYSLILLKVVYYNLKNLIIDLRKFKVKSKAVIFIKKHCFNKKIQSTDLLKTFVRNYSSLFNGVSIYFCITTVSAQSFLLHNICLNYLFLLPTLFNKYCIEYAGVTIFKTIKLYDNFLLFTLQNLKKQLYCAMHSMTTLLQKNYSTGVFLKMHKKTLKLLKRREKMQLLFIKFFINYFKILFFKKKIILILKKFNRKVNSKLIFIFAILKKSLRIVIILPKIKYGAQKFKRVKAIKKTLRKLLLKKI